MRIVDFRLSLTDLEFSRGERIRGKADRFSGRREEK